MWNMKTKSQQSSSVFDLVAKQIDLLHSLKNMRYATYFESKSRLYYSRVFWFSLHHDTFGSCWITNLLKMLFLKILKVLES